MMFLMHEPWSNLIVNTKHLRNLRELSRKIEFDLWPTKPLIFRHFWVLFSSKYNYIFLHGFPWLRADQDQLCCWEACCRGRLTSWSPPSPSALTQDHSSTWSPTSSTRIKSSSWWLDQRLEKTEKIGQSLGIDEVIQRAEATMGKARSYSQQQSAAFHSFINVKSLSLLASSKWPLQSWRNCSINV